MARSLAAALLLGAAAALALAAPLRAQRVTVERRDDDALRVEPGTSATAVFRVANAGGAPVVAYPAAVLPRGWTAVAPEGPAELAAGARVVRLVGFAVPRDARAGSYFVRLGVRGAADSVRVIVAGRRALAVRAAGAPRFAVAGDPYVTRFVVENRGNAPEAVALRLASSHGVEARLDSVRLLLAPGEAREVAVRVSTPRRITVTIPHRVEVGARAEEDGGVAASASTSVAIVGRGGSGAPRPRLPVEVRLRNGTTLPAVSGSGALTGGGASRVDFLFRPADAAGSLRGDASEYRVQLTAPGADLKLGDQVYALSPLTQPGRYGFGAGATGAAGPLSGGGYAMRDRRAPGAGEEWGAQARLALGRVGSLGVQYLGRAAGALATARLLLTPTRQWTVDAEAGAGARSVAVHGSGARASAYGRHLRTDAAYAADFAGESVDEAGVSLRPWRALHLSGTASRHRDAAPHPLAAGAGSRELLAASIGWGSMAADLRDERRDDAGHISSVALRGTFRAGPLWISPRAEAGRWDDTAGASAPFRRLSAHGGLTHGQHSLSAWLEHSTRSPYALRPGGSLAATIDAALRPAASTRLHATLRGSRVDGVWRGASGEVGLWQDVLRGQRLVARARWGLSGVEIAEGPRLLLDYVIPIGLPTPRGGGAGRVAGRVLDAESGRGVAGVPVRLGNQVVLTDRGGRWSFEGVVPGTLALEIDRLAAGLDRVPLGPVPGEVTVSGGRTARVDVALVRGGRVLGTIRVLDFAEGPSPAAGPPPTVESGGLRDAVVVLASGADSLRRVTDASGRFDFADLRPGRWALSVEHAELPAHHRMERDTMTLEVAGGGAREVVLRVLPRYRPVRIIAGGEMRAGAPDAPALTAANSTVAARDAVPAPPVPQRPAPVAPPRAPAAVAPRAAAVPRRAPPARRAPAAPAPRSEIGASGFSDWPHTTYTVQPGDASLVAIAWLTYRDGALWPRLWLANRHVLGTPARIAPGQVLVVPAPGPLTAAERAALREYPSRR
jgi:nucleoid-associated protein YgaU